MIYGIGTDIVDIRRIERIIDTNGERFLAKIFTPLERSEAERRSATAALAFFAKRYAAKEACAKALGTGIGESARWQEMEVTRTASGQPRITLSGLTAEGLRTMLPPGMHPTLHLSLSDEPPYAVAYVIIEARSA